MNTENELQEIKNTISQILANNTESLKRIEISFEAIYPQGSIKPKVIIEYFDKNDTRK